MTLLQLLAFGLFGYALLQKDMLEFAGLRQSKSESKLITDGVYRIVRHPLYLAGIILIFTKPEMTLLDLTAAALVSIYFITGAYIEERRLVSTFGDRYRKYQQGRHIETWMISELGVSSKAPFRGLLLSSDCSAPGITPL